MLFMGVYLFYLLVFCLRVFFKGVSLLRLRVFSLVSLVNSSHWLRVFLFGIARKLVSLASRVFVFCFFLSYFVRLGWVSSFGRVVPFCVCNINTQNKYALRSIIAHCFGLMFFRVG